MSTKKGIGYSSLSDKVYIGKQNTKKGMWIGEKEDITDDFLHVAFQYFGENTIRSIKTGEKENLLINILNDKESVEKLIRKLSKNYGRSDKKTEKEK